MKAPINEYYATILLGVAQTMGCLVGSVFIRSTGKRPLVFASLVGNCICFFSAAIYSHYVISVPGFADVALNQSRILNGSEVTVSKVMPSLEDNFDIIDSSRAIRSVYHINDANELPSILTDETGVASRFIDDILHEHRHILRAEKEQDTWVPTILLVLGSLFAHMGIKMIPWMLIGEVCNTCCGFVISSFCEKIFIDFISQVYPTTVRGTAAGFSSTIGYLSAFVANKVFLDMVKLFTLPGTFFVYSCVAIVGVIFLYFKLPETENRTLLEIEANFDKVKKEYLKQQKVEQQQQQQLQNQQGTHANDASNVISERTEYVAVETEITRH